MEGSRAARGALGELMRWERARLKAEIESLTWFSAHGYETRVLGLARDDFQPQ
jgi:hypothetical protein